MERFTSGRVPCSGMEQVFGKLARWQCWLDVEAELAHAQGELGLIPVPAAAAITAHCRVECLDIPRVEAEIHRQSHPLMPLIVELSNAVPSPYGGWVHWGVTTQNITQTGDTLLLRRAFDIIQQQLLDILAALASLAERGSEMIMAGRTHGQHAVPTTFGYRVAGWIDEYVRHLDRLDGVAPRLFMAILGGAAGTSATLGEDPQRLQALIAERLGLRPMPVPSRNIADHSAEFVTTLALFATTSGKIAREIYQLMKPEYQEAEEPLPEGTVGSSTMPHKRNPQLCQDIIGIAAELRALVPFALEMTLTEHDADNSPSVLFDIQKRACELTAESLSRIHLIVAGLRLDPDRMRRNLDLSGGMIASEAIMLRLGEALGRQTAHEVVYDAAQAAATTADAFLDILARDPRVTNHLDTDTIRQLLVPESHLGLASRVAHQQATRAREVVASRRKSEA